MYRLLFIDLDGTLLDYKKQISRQDIEAIKTARSKGLRVMIATGRPTVGAGKALAAIGYQQGDYLISNNGATIISLDDNRSQQSWSISVRDHRLIDSFCRAHQISHYSFDENYCLSEDLNEYTEWERQYNGIEIRQVRFADLDDNQKLLKIMAYGKPERIAQAMQAVTPEMLNRYAVIRSADILLEFLHPKATKGNAVKTVTEWYGFNREEVICIGDAGNDLDMISYAGLGIAMGNAKSEVMAVADHITDSNNKSGIAKAIASILS